MGREGLLQFQFSRRKFIAGSAALGAAVAIGATCDPYSLRKAEQDKNPLPLQHKSWVWQFSADGAPETIANALGSNGCGVLVKTHDGVDWMSRYDNHGSAVSGPAQIARLARIFENEGAQFHAWSVVKGIDPIREAQMTAEVLASGARSIVLDLEGGSGFWAGNADTARRFGDELRRLSPYGRVDISIDPRPWRIYHNVPMDEFVVYTDAIWPQLYWDTFNSSGNLDLYRRNGFDAGPAGMTPEFLLNANAELMSRYGRPIVPVGQGAARDPWMWERFVYRAWQLGHPEVSVWRHAVTPTANFGVLQDNAAGTEPQLPVQPTPQPSPTAGKTNTPTKTPKPSRTPTPRPSRTPTPTRTITPTKTPSVITSLTPTPTPTP